MAPSLSAVLHHNYGTLGQVKAILNAAFRQNLLNGFTYVRNTKTTLTKYDVNIF